MPSCLISAYFLMPSAVRLILSKKGAAALNAAAQRLLRLNATAQKTSDTVFGVRLTLFQS